MADTGETDFSCSFRIYDNFTPSMIMGPLRRKRAGLHVEPETVRGRITETGHQLLERISK